jgi:SAM-dependent methyltransferase
VETLDLLVDLHQANSRQGPGDDEQTAMALQLTSLDTAAPLSVADIGCGTGAATLALARLLPQAHITAVDFLPAFLVRLRQRAAAAGVAARIHARPRELQAHWDHEYPEVDTASAKVRLLERYGYSPRGYFVLPESCWVHSYFAPLRAGFSEFLHRQGHSEAARAVVAENEQEIALYDAYKAHFGYGVYVARRVD